MLAVHRLEAHRREKLVVQMVSVEFVAGVRLNSSMELDLTVARVSDQASAERQFTIFVFDHFYWHFTNAKADRATLPFAF